MRIWGTDHQIRKVFPEEQRIASQEAVRFFRMKTMPEPEAVTEDRLPDLRTPIRTMWIVVLQEPEPQDLGLEKKLKIPEKNA